MNLKKMRKLKEHFRDLGHDEFKTFRAEFKSLFEGKETSRREAKEIILEKYKNIVDSF